MSYNRLIKQTIHKARENNDLIMLKRMDDLQNYITITENKPVQMFFTMMEYLYG